MYSFIDSIKSKFGYRLNQRGDTIVEVMLVLAILSLAFGISYATANKGLSKSLNAEQHSEALGIINSQIEELRKAISSGNFSIASGQYFCMTSATQATQLPGAFITSQQQDAQQGYAEYGQGSGSCTDLTTYHVSITAASPTTSAGSTYSGAFQTPVPCSTAAGCAENSYTFVVRWEGNGSLGPQQEALTYRIGSVVAGTGDYLSGDTIVPSSPTPTNSSQTIDGASGSCYNPLSDTWYCVGGSTSVGGSNYNTIASYQAYLLYPGGTPSSGPYNFIMTYNTSLFGQVSPQTDPNGYTFNINYTNIANGAVPPPPASAYNYNVTISDGNCRFFHLFFCNSVSAQLPPPVSNGSNVESAAINFPQLTDLAADGPIVITWSNDYCCTDPSGQTVDANFQINNITLTPN